MNIYVFGNGNLTFEQFKEFYEKPLEIFKDDKKVNFSICDFRGVDTLVMELLKSRTKNVTIFHIGEKPRYLPDQYRTKVSSWEMRGGFIDDESRDLAAILDCTHYLAEDFNSNERRMSGTQRNILKCQEMNKIRIV